MSVTLGEHFAQSPLGSDLVSLVKREQDFIGSLLISPVFVILSPILLENFEFSVVIDEFINSKFSLIGMKTMKMSSKLITSIFKDSNHDIPTLQDHFTDRNSLLLLMERDKGDKLADELIG